MPNKDCLLTQKQKGSPPEIEEKRIKRIGEALGFKPGTKESPKKYVVAELPGGWDVYFVKPGKEAFNTKRINVHDMTPLVGDGSQKLSFQKVWAYITNISSIDENIFKQTCLLIYRIGYLLDHEENNLGRIRYSPKPEIRNCIADMDAYLKTFLPFGGLLGFLHFIDILCWNEDVKYHVEYDKPIFRGKHTFNTGSINTALSCLTVPNIVHQFRKDVFRLKNASELDPMLILDGMQRISRSRGICIPNKGELISWLSPYIYE